MSKASSTKPAAKKGTLTDRHSGEQRRAGVVLTGLVMEGWALHTQIVDLSEQLDAIKSKLLALMTEETLEIKGVCRAVAATTERVSIADAVELQNVLGERFSDLVKIETQYKPEPRLLQMAADADADMAADLRPCLKVTTSRSVRFLSA